MAANKPKVYPIYDEDTSKSIQPGTQEEFELKKLPLEEYVCSVRLWCCTVERNGKATFYRMIETTKNTETKIGKQLSKLTWTKRPEFMYGVITSTGALGFLLARLRRRKIPGQIMYGTIGAGLAWGCYYIADPVNRSTLSKEMDAGRKEMYSWTKDKYDQMYSYIASKMKSDSKPSESKRK